MPALSPTDLGTILGVWAHPDDEAYLSAGVMAAARDAGQRVVCVTATRGEHGTPDPQAWPPSRLARTRGAEVRASLAALGVTEHRFLDLVDGTLRDADRRDAVRRLVRIVREVRPDTILTFGPDGLTGHADHRCVSSWATAARDLAAPEARLLYATSTAAHERRWAALHARFDVYECAPDVPPVTDPDELVVDLALDGWAADRKLAALRAQATQTAGLVAALGEDTYREWIAVEAFRAAPCPAAPRPAATAGAAAAPVRVPVPVPS